MCLPTCDPSGPVRSLVSLLRRGRRVGGLVTGALVTLAPNVELHGHGASSILDLELVVLDVAAPEIGNGDCHLPGLASCIELLPDGLAPRIMQLPWPCAATIGHAQRRQHLVGAGCERALPWLLRTWILCGRLWLRQLALSRSVLFTSLQRLYREQEAGLRRPSMLTCVESRKVGALDGSRALALGTDEKGWLPSTGYRSGAWSAVEQAPLRVESSHAQQGNYEKECFGEMWGCHASGGS